jgi:hypothetical protein
VRAEIEIPALPNTYIYAETAIFNFPLPRFNVESLSIGQIKALWNAMLKSTLWGGGGGGRGTQRPQHVYIWPVYLKYFWPWVFFYVITSSTLLENRAPNMHLENRTNLHEYGFEFIQAHVNVDENANIFNSQNFVRVKILFKLKLIKVKRFPIQTL